MIEELFIGFAKVTFGAIAFFIERGAVFHAAASTDSEVPTHEALVAEVFLGSGKSSFFTAGRKFFYRYLEDITQPPFRLDEKVTAKGVAGMLDHDILTALPVERADRVPARDIIRQHRIEVADAQISRAMLVPAVKQPA